MSFYCYLCDIESDYPFVCNTYEELEKHQEKCNFTEFICKFCNSKDGYSAPKLNDWGFKNACNYCKEYVKKRRFIQDNLN